MAQMNPLLTAIEHELEAHINPQMMPIYQRIVTAGLKVMSSPQTHDMMLHYLNAPGDILANIGTGIAELTNLLINQSKGTAPPNAMMAAATTLLLHALDFAEKAGKLKVDKSVVSGAMREFNLAMHKKAAGQNNLPPTPGQAPAAQPATPSQPTGLMGA